MSEQLSDTEIDAAILCAVGLEMDPNYAPDIHDRAIYRAGMAAGRRAAIEECAKVCDKEGEHWRYSSNAGMTAADECGQKIRALATHSADKGSG